jgi:hypothetical protein
MHRAESKSELKYMEQKLESNRKETNALIEAIRQDIKDFHGRLCAIEEKNREKR